MDFNINEKIIVPCATEVNELSSRQVLALAEQSAREVLLAIAPIKAEQQLRH
ncbi:MAG: hypothetical protein KC680_01055 [Candidatus Peregrinibacteria bacterium]|nr:hypothetical protein [Candidatus Peregrinibacteria bacterium]